MISTFAVANFGANVADATPSVPSSSPPVGASGAAPKGVPPSPSKGPPGNSRPSDAVSAADLTILQRLHDANQLEVQMGHLAQAKGSSNAVKEFGRKLVSDHTRADQRIGEFLKKRSLDLTALATTTSADPAHSTTADQFGATFDRTFAAQMARDHQRTISFLESARVKTRDLDLKALYEEILQTLKDHKNTAQVLVEGGSSAKK